MNFLDFGRHLEFWRKLKMLSKTVTERFQANFRPTWFKGVALYTIWKNLDFSNFGRHLEF